MGSHGRLLALSAADGAELWRVELTEAFGAKRPNWGYSGSPLIDGDLLLLEVGGKDNRGVVAFEKVTGKVRWGALDGDPAHASPVVMTIGGIKQYVVTRRAGPQTVALRPDGSVLWTHPGPFSVIASALFIPPDKVYVSGGDDAPPKSLAPLPPRTLAATLPPREARVVRLHVRPGRLLERAGADGEPGRVLLAFAPVGDT